MTKKKREIMSAAQLADLMPELPPGYEIELVDYDDDPDDFVSGWQITIRGNVYDGRSDDEETPKERGVAVAECWSMWIENDCDKSWIDFIRAVRKAAS